MGYPAIRDISTGISSGGTISVTMPSNLKANDLILIYFTTYEAYVNSTPVSSSGNFVKLNSTSDAYAERQVCIFYGIAIEGTINNYLTVSLSSGSWGAAYIIYRITDHGVYTGTDIDNDVYPHVACSLTTYETLPLTVTTPAGSLYIASVSYSNYITDMAVSSYVWSNYTYRSHAQTPISTQSINWPYSTDIFACTWNHTQTTVVRTYLSTIVRIKPGSQSTGEGGFGIYVPRTAIGLP
jgi:hypothetical protein